MFKRKALLIITNSYPDKGNTHYGGIFVKEQVNYLRDYFEDIYVISPQPLGVNRNLRDYRYDNVNVYFPRFLHMPLNIFRRKLGDNFFKSALKVIRRGKIKFDLIHAHFTWPSGYAGTLLKKKFNVPLIITAHGFDVYDVPFRNSIYRAKIVKALNEAERIITVSNSNFEVLTKKLGVPGNKISIIPNGFDGKIFRPMPKKEVREKLGLPLEKKIVLSVGNLISIKGYEYLIRAAEIAMRKRKDTMFVIVGNGPLRGKLEQLVNSLSLKGIFLFVGSKHHDEVSLWMNAADLFVLPSLSEGNPTVMFEALGVGLPFIGTKVGGIPEIITSEDYGLLCEPANPEDLAEKILIALEKDWDRKKIRKYAKQFTWESIVSEVVKVYNKVLVK